MKTVDIYTDGACSGNPGPGGWCAIIMCEGREKVITGAYESTTNNRMEVLAAVEGLAALKTKVIVNLYSDSAYLVNAIEQHWLDKWKANRWRNSEGKEAKNRDLWERLDALIAEHEVKFIKVKGHSDNVYNNRCDKEAREAIRALLRDGEHTA